MADRSSAEPPAKMAKKEATDEDLSDLLAQPKEILLQIVNNLDPDSFRELTFTCRYLFDFCLNAKGINIGFPINDVEIGQMGAIEYLDAPIYYSCACESMGNPQDDAFARCLQKLLKWPFSVQIDGVRFLRMMNPALRMQVLDLFVRNRVKKIRWSTCWVVHLTVQEVEDFTTEFVSLFGINVLLLTTDHDHLSIEVIEACLKIPVDNLYLENENGEFDADVLINCSIPTFSLDSSITLAGLDTIMQIWRIRDLKKWTFRYNFYSDEFADYFNRYEVRLFSYDGPIDFNNPPVFMALWDNQENRTAVSFYVLRQDGQIFCVTIDPSDNLNGANSHFIDFRMCRRDEGPLALRDF